MNEVNKTLYIPLYGKAYVSKRGLFIKDEKAEQIWEQESFPLKGKARSKWLAYYMGIRAAVFDGWLKEKMQELPGAAVLHIGCGLDSRILRVGDHNHKWYDVDLPAVIEERRLHFEQTGNYKLLAGDAADPTWLSSVVRCDSAIVVMEGVSMYLKPEKVRSLAEALCSRFGEVALLADCYTSFGAKMSRIKNPVKEVGVSRVYGIDGPAEFEGGGLCFCMEHPMTPRRFVEELRGYERFVFSRLYAGGLSKRIYKIYEYKKG